MIGFQRLPIGIQYNIGLRYSPLPYLVNILKIDMSKEVHYCSVCGVSSEVKKVGKNKAYGDFLCEKHKEQYRRYGKILDTNPRGVFDPNEIRLLENYAEIDTYGPRGEVVTTFKIDLEDVSKLGKYKWRTIFKNNKPYMVTGNQNSPKLYFHRIVLVTNKQVDHISGDTSDNRRNNLREVTIQENMMNLKKKSNNTSGIRGVSFDKKRNNWKCDFTINKIRIYIKASLTIEEAVYLRYLCETTFLKDKRNTSNDNVYKENIEKLSSNKKEELKKYFLNKINTMKVGV